MAATTGEFQLGPGNGRVTIKTFRAGLAARVGHDLTLAVTRWSAQVTVPADDAGGLAAATVSAELDLGSLEVREGTGGVMALTDSDRREITKTMRKTLGGVTTASFRSSRVIPSGGSGGAVEGTLTLNGRSQPARLQLAVPGPGRYRGSAAVVQSAFGIKPYSGMFGALKLKDEVTVEFDLDLSPA